MSIYGDKDFAAPRYLYPTPATLPDDETCVTISVPFNSAWIGLWIGVLLILCDPENFVQFEGGLTPDETADVFRNALINALTEETTVCSPQMQTPYWDSETSVDDTAPADDQPWYGFIEDFLAPIEGLNFVQNAAIWVITGFVAYAATPGAAIFFRTVARRFVLAVQVQDVGEVIRVVVDSANYNIDTSGRSVGDIIDLDVLVTDPELDTHDIYVINTGIPE